MQVVLSYKLKISENYENFENKTLNSTKSIASVGTSAIIILLKEFAMLISVFNNSKDKTSCFKSRSLIEGVRLFGIYYNLRTTIIIIHLKCD